MLRRYEQTDLAQLLDVWAAATAIAHPFLSNEYLENELDRIPEVYLPNADTWVWEMKRRVVGFLALIGNEIGGLFVHPNYQRNGIGSALVDHARYQYGELEVEVFKENAIGRAFYETYGFELMWEGYHESTGCSILRMRLPGPELE